MGNLKEFFLVKEEERRLKQENLKQEELIDASKEDIQKTIDLENTQKKIETININTSFNGFKSTFIDLYERRPIVIWFIFKEKKYKVSFDYGTTIINSHVTSGGEKEKQIIKVNYLSNIKIQPRHKVGYGEYASVYKYRNVGMKLEQIKNFIKKVLFEYLN